MPSRKKKTLPDLHEYIKTQKPTTVDSMLGIIKLPKGMQPEEIVEKTVLKKHLK